MGDTWFRLLDKWLISIQWSFKNTLNRTQTINANANFENASNAIVSALAGFNLVGERVEGELIAA